MLEEIKNTEKEQLKNQEHKLEDFPTEEYIQCSCHPKQSTQLFSSFYLHFEQAKYLAIHSAGEEGLKGIPALKRINESELAIVDIDMYQIHINSIEAAETQTRVLRAVNGRINGISEEREAYIDIIINAKKHIKEISKEEEKLKKKLVELTENKVNSELKKIYVDPRHLKTRGYIQQSHAGFFASKEESIRSLKETDKFLKFNIGLKNN